MEIAKVSIAKIGLASAEPTLDDFRDIGERLKEAFSKIGFVYLCDHGIDDDVISRWNSQLSKSTMNEQRLIIN